MDYFFPLEISVLSSDALGHFITSEYFPQAILKCRLFYRGLHDTYKVVTDDKEFFFKVYRQGKRSMEEIQAEIDLINHLKWSGIEVAFPISKRDGEYISQFNTVNGIRYGVLYTSVGTQEFGKIEESHEKN